MLLLVSLLGCITADNFPDQLGAALCDRLEECAQAAFDAVYDDLGECQDDFSSSLDSSALDDCDFDAGEANACLKSVRETTCDDIFSDAPSWYGACEDVYTGC